MEEKMEEAKSTKPQAGEWDKTQAYPQAIKFEQNTSVVVTFGKDFTNPKEMPNKDGDGVFYIFDCIVEGKASSICTSSWTMLRSLKSKMPLGGKTLIITKKNVNGKNMFYVETPDQNENRTFEPDSSPPVTEFPTEAQLAQAKLDAAKSGVDKKGLM